ncbi:hypothetical protein FD14_GL000942 [Secundilactobacillus similis DSM 23365 = JCM 2765]|uniref:DUF2087 domain-containing protein n=1 Tax=Secundilactobacillus similis DSM 23365 = JCM 2765 TaxID=1423804 RepID=A0A0R2EZG9_9LACO|nr:hypothetical protein FD14_GL000942 [Secundilactobacillus similis DSM 23365 = JCM 2765]
MTAMQRHLTHQHQGAVNALLQSTSKYNTLTATQRDLLTAFASGDKDKLIAEQLDLSPSTVRHQKFTFREKAKRAKLYLAQYEAIFEDSSTSMLPIPPSITHPDDRFKISETDYATLVQKYFDFSQPTPVLTQLPKGEKKLITLLYRISEELDFDRHYSTAEINSVLKPIYFDYGLLERYLVDYGFVARTPDGRDYWRIF